MNYIGFIMEHTLFEFHFLNSFGTTGKTITIIQNVVLTKQSDWLKQLSSRDDNHDTCTPVKRLECRSLRAPQPESLPLHRPAFTHSCVD